MRHHKADEVSVLRLILHGNALMYRKFNWQSLIISIICRPSTFRWRTGIVMIKRSDRNGVQRIHMEGSIHVLVNYLQKNIPFEKL